MLLYLRQKLPCRCLSLKARAAVPRQAPASLLRPPLLILLSFVFSLVFLFTFTPYNSYVIHFNCDWNRNCCAKKRYYNFSLLLVYSDNFSFFFFEQVCNHLNYISDFYLEIFNFRLDHFLYFVVCNCLADDAPYMLNI